MLELLEHLWREQRPLLSEADPREDGAWTDSTCSSIPGGLVRYVRGTSTNEGPGRTLGELGRQK